MHIVWKLVTAFALFIFIEPIYADVDIDPRSGQTIFDSIDDSIDGEEDLLEIHGVIDNRTLFITAKTRSPPDQKGDVNYYFNIDTDKDMKRDYQIIISGSRIWLCSKFVEKARLSISDNCYNFHGGTLSFGDILELSLPLEPFGNATDVGISAFTYSGGILKNPPSTYKEVGLEGVSLFNIDGNPEDWTNFNPISIGKSYNEKRKGILEAYATRYGHALYVMIDPISDINLSKLNYAIYIDYDQDAKEDYSVFFDKYKSFACIKNCTHYYGWDSAFLNVVEFKTELPRTKPLEEPESIGISLGVFDKDYNPISITPFKIVEPLKNEHKIDSFDAEELNKVNAIYNITISQKDPSLAHVTLKLDNVYGGITKVSIDFKNMYFWHRFINFSSSSNLEETKTGFISNITGNEYTLDYYVRLNIPIEYKEEMRSYSTRNWTVTDTTSLFPYLSFAKYPHANFRFILHFNIPPSWKIVSEMENIGEREYRSYYSGIVKPEGIIGMGDFEIFEKNRYGKKFVLARYGDSSADPEDVLEMFIKLTPILSEMTDSDVGEKIVIINAPKPMYVGFAKSDSIFVNVEDPIVGDDSRSVYAHEYTHLFQKWYGIDKKEDNTEWIKEGIAEYYSSKALLEAGYITEDEHEKFLKDYYYKSEKFGNENLNNATRENEIPIYMKGAVIVWKLDNLISERTGGEKDFSDVLRKTNRDFNRKKLGNLEFEKIVEDVSGTDFSAFFQKYVYGSELPSAELTLYRAPGIEYQVQNFDILPIRDAESFIVLSNGEPISKSFVRIKDKTAITDSRGGVHIEDMSNGLNVLEIGKPGFFTSRFYVLLVPKETMLLVFFLSLMGISYFYKKIAKA